ncbi:MAG: hypothetical protein GX626_12325 [Spirochaetales bacterium]|jgi:hypothetical protein|nr:hypothetical protein [Spirochaetales bacterium]
MRTMPIALLCLVLLIFVSCDPDGGSDLNPTQEKIKLLLDEFRLADEEVMQFKFANGGAFPAEYTEEAGTRTYSNYTNANGTLIDGTDKLSAPPFPQDGEMDMDFSGGKVGTLTRLRLNMTIHSIESKTVISCLLNDTDVTEDAQAMYDNP